MPFYYAWFNLVSYSPGVRLLIVVWCVLYCRIQMEGKLAEELYAESLKVSKLELSSNLADDQGDKLNGNKILYQ